RFRSGRIRPTGRCGPTAIITSVLRAVADSGREGSACSANLGPVGRGICGSGRDRGPARRRSVRESLRSGGGGGETVEAEGRGRGSDEVSAPTRRGRQRTEAEAEGMSSRRV